jgi:hypothetical protein
MDREKTACKSHVITANHAYYYFSFQKIGTSSLEKIVHSLLEGEKKNFKEERQTERNE